MSETTLKFTTGTKRGRPYYTLVGPKGAVEWLDTYVPTAYFHRNQPELYDPHGSPVECYLDTMGRCWPEAGSLYGARQDAYTSGDPDRIRDAMTDDYRVAICDEKED